MVLLGIVLIVLGFFFSHLLLVLGVILLVVGLVFGGVGYSGHPIGGRRHWF